MGTILVGYDDSEPAQRALEQAADRAASEGATLVVLTVAEMPLSPEMTATGEFLDASPVSMELVEPPDVEAALGHAKEYLSGRGLEADLVWSAGEPGASLVDTAQERGASLIVIGAHHQHFFTRLFGLGVEDEVKRRAGCEVLIVE